MFDPFGIKRLKMKKQELEEALAKANAANRELSEIIKGLQYKLHITEGQLNEIRSNMTVLESELILRRSHDNVRTKFTDDEKYY